MGLPAPAGVRLGIDPGDARIGVAACDPSGILATPLETVPRADDGSDLARIAVLVEESAAVLVYVGLPRSLNGGEGPAAGRVREFARTLAGQLAPCPVRLVDERLSTVTAEAVLRERGKKGKKRRAVVDQAAAVVILQAAIDAERARGSLTGETVDGEAVQ
jgi:putative Holliday junction resolvase